MLHPQNFVKWIPTHLWNMSISFRPVIPWSRRWIQSCKSLGQQASVRSWGGLQLPAAPHCTPQTQRNRPTLTGGSAHRKITSIHPHPSRRGKWLAKLGPKRTACTWTMMINGVNPIQKTRPWKRTRVFWSVVKIDFYIICIYIYLIYYIK